MIDVTVYTFENKSTFKIAHNNDKSDKYVTGRVIYSTDRS